MSRPRPGRPVRPGGPDRSTRAGTAYAVRAPAKINLHLGVGAPREDGFHPLSTVYQAVGIYDDVVVSPAPMLRLGLRAAAHVDAATVPIGGGSNIVERAAELLAGRYAVADRADVLIHKAIPVAGGMAGGSADAAAALVALDRLWDTRVEDEELLELAARLGSDVPFALVGGTALGEGRGELVTPVPDATTWWWVVAPAAEGLSTPAVFAHFDRLHPNAPSAPPAADALLAALATGDPAVLGAALHNDLEVAAFDLRPELARLVARGEELGAVRGLLSGSGPTVVHLCASADVAREVAAGLQDDRRATGEPVLVANGPVAGAHLVEYA